MVLSKRILIQLAFFSVITLVGGSIMIFNYMGLPGLLFGVGQYKVSVQLPAAAGLYKNANVTYRGTEVGKVTDVRLDDTGVVADLALKSGIPVPRDLTAEVHSASSIGEQYVALLPHGDGSPLKDGDVIPRDRTSVPPDISTLLAATDKSLDAIPGDNLQTAVSEAATAVGGLGPDLARLVKGSTTLAIDARNNLDSLTNLIDNSKPILDSQTATAGSIENWAANLASVTSQLKSEDNSVQGILQNSPEAADQARQLFDRLQPTLPVVLANLVTIGNVAVTYQPNIEQLLVLAPSAVEVVQGAELTNRNTKQAYKGAFLSFNLNLNLPPPCLTGYLPAQQARATSLTDYPDRPAGDFYCRVPQDSQFNVRGARNYPCETRPGKRAPTVKMCESDENYVPLNDGFNWKGDPNATLSGQSIPQLPPGQGPGPNAEPPAGAPGPAPTAPPIAVAEYDPATGSYLGPDGHVYTQANLAHNAQEQTWQSMMMPPKQN
ncbi:mammalian cell entry protein [Mycobacterium sp. 852013-50091_SCH5140682]|uniref:MCE family protein n=1 Tax=Mycobacterium sp. 852013-50091_SCH5140682 TaxID=1834109 RepID=UPI0007EAF1C5|nr:MlaD family protein [Mycobacterium sp. 852013-50091_SCH5140682]OBC11999.1 mammalian cell entry protein [Mycobacterium sp. 852013-50091_SCH5140682]